MAQFEIPYHGAVQTTIEPTELGAVCRFHGLGLSLEAPGSVPFAMMNHGFTFRFESEKPVAALGLEIRWRSYQSDGATSTMLLSFGGDVNTLTIDGESEEEEGTDTYEIAFEEPVEEAEVHMLFALVAQRIDPEDYFKLELSSLTVTLLDEATAADEDDDDDDDDEEEDGDEEAENEESSDDTKNA